MTHIPTTHFKFTAKEIDDNRSTYLSWHQFVRRREAEMGFSLLEGKTFEKGLEIGAGDGGQSVEIAKYCDSLICTEFLPDGQAWRGDGTILQRHEDRIEYKVMDAQDMSMFEDSTFDMIFSSNVLEHIPDVNKCLGECRRVLKPDGISLHAMPSRHWKVFNMLLCPLKLHRPGIHGVSSSNLREFISFGVNQWGDVLESNGFRVDSVSGMPFYVGLGNSFIPILKLGNYFRFPSSHLFVCSKK